MGIGASLYVGAEQCFDAVVRIVGDLLEFVNGYKAGFVCLVEVSENLIKRNLWIYEVADAYAPDRQAVDVE